MSTADPLDTGESVSDAIGLLARDQRLFSALFKEFDLAGPQQLDPLARRIGKMVRVHLQIKEEVFYPAARRALPTPTTIDRSEEEVRGIRQSLALLESLSSDDPAFLPTVRALADEMAGHLRREESELLSALRSTQIDLISVGITLAERRNTLMDVLGLHADDEEAAIYPEENPAIARAIAERQRDRQE